MLGADLGDLRSVVSEFENEREWVLAELTGSFDLRYRALFWIGPDKERVRNEIWTIIGEPLAHFDLAIEQSIELLRSGIARQHQASAARG